MYRDCETTYINIQEQMKAFEEEAKVYRSVYRNNPELLKDLKMECYMFRKKAGDDANELERILRTMNRNKKNRNK